MLKVVRAKLHAIRVTGADLNYHGSITLDPDHCTEAAIYPLEFVEIWNKHSGARISTYVIYGVPGSRCCILNGAAARTCQVGDEIIIAASSYVQPHELYALEPRVLTFRLDNSIDQRLSYQVFESEARKFDFQILECPSSDDLRQGVGFRSGGSGPSGFNVRQPARDGASGGWTGSVV